MKFRRDKYTDDINISNIERLQNSVIMQAVEDYEQAICNNNVKRQEEVEEFAKDNSKYWTKLNLNIVLKKIREAWPEFEKIAEENTEDIIEDTKRKKFGHPLYKPKYSCPLCGGGLYADRTKLSNKNYIRIICTHCKLAKVVKIDKDKKK